MSLPSETELSHRWRRAVLYFQLSSLNLNFLSTTASGWLERLDGMIGAGELFKLTRL